MDKGEVIGQQIGNYKITSLLGEGGMGSVYLAEHPTIGRRVAIKILRPELARDVPAVTRFLNEARAANAIRHRNIIEMFDAGTMPDGTPYIVMELLEGENLAQRLERVQRFSIDEALSITIQVTAALTATHAKGITHRDLKPDNLFIIQNDDDSGTELVKVLDFGIAKLHQNTFGGISQTKTGSLMGTPLYMSPEQCRGNKEVDHRTDIYSLGLILYEMICNGPPFQSQGFGEIIASQLSAIPPSPRSRNPEIPLLLESIIMRALAKQPEDRFESAQAFRNALKNWRTGGAVVTPIELQQPGARQSLAVMTAVPVSGSAAGRTRAYDSPGGTTGERRPPTGSGGQPAESRTTLSSGAGESAQGDTPARKRWLFLAGAGMAAVVGLALIMTVGKRNHAPAPSDTPVVVAPAAAPAAAAPAPAPVAAPAPPVPSAAAGAVEPAAHVAPAGASPEEANKEKDVKNELGNEKRETKKPVKKDRGPHGGAQKQWKSDIRKL